MSKNGLIEIPLSKGKVALVDVVDYEIVSQFKWHLHPLGYAATTQGGRKNKHTILMHRLLSNADKSEMVDHENGDKLNNSRSNLRVCSGTQNQGNRNLNANNTSGYKGVSFSKARGVWVAKIDISGKTKYLGSSQCRHEAAIMYNKKALEVFGEFAKINKIEEGVI